MRFSQRIGKNPIKTVPQVESLDEDLKNRLWNTLLDNFFNNFGREILLNLSNNTYETELGKICKTFWKDFFGNSIDEIPVERGYGNVNTSEVLKNLKSWYYNAEWFNVYDFIEYIVELDDRKNGGFSKACNLVLEKSVSGYRIVNGKIAQITSNDEIKEIEEATTQTKKWKSVNTHLDRSLYLLTDRENPDFRNSIKESISAVESICKIIINDDTATLGKALIEIDNKFPMHPALKKAFTALYGYTSDESGIRHSLDETGANVGFEEAKFMLVTCSAFINYLKNKMTL